MDADDDALSWDGEIRDPSYVDGSRRSRPASDYGDAPRRDGSGSDDRAGGLDLDDVTGGRATGHSATLDGRPDQIPAALLVAYSALGAVYALFTIGWVIAILRSTVTLPNLFFNAMYQVGQWLAAASPLAFFGVVFLLTPRSQSRRVTAGRLLALALGLILVAPWPFIVGGAA